MYKDSRSGIPFDNSWGQNLALPRNATGRLRGETLDDKILLYRDRAL